MVNLIKIIEDLEEDENKTTRYIGFRKKKKQYEWLTLEHFLNWIKDEKLIDYVFGEYSHPEIIRKSGELLSKMCQQGLFSKKEIDLIWSVFDSNYHEDIIRAALEVIEMVVRDCDEEIISEIRKRVHKFKKSDYDQSMIMFMKSFIIAEMTNFYKNDNMKKTGGMKSSLKKFFNMGGGNSDVDSVMTKEHVDWVNKDLEILWKLPTQKEIPNNVKIQAAKVIPEILSNEFCSDKTRENYVEMARKGLKNGDQVYNNLMFIKALLTNSQGYSEIKKTIKDNNIADIVIVAAESYLTKVSKLFKDPYDYNNVRYIEKHLAEKDPNFMMGKTHREHIEKMFEIIQFIIDKSYNSQPFTEKEIEKMFNVFITKRISNFESETLFDLIQAERRGVGYSSDPYNLGDKKLRKHIFMTCLVKKNYVTPHDYSPKSIRCFKDLFLAMNERENHIVLDRAGVIIKSVKNIGLEGVETLWEIACHASNPIVQERAGYFLALLYYLYMDKKQPSQWEKETDKIVEYLMDILKQTVHGRYETLNHVKVLRQFIDAFETLGFPDHFRIFYKKLYEVEDENEEEMMELGYDHFLNRKWNRKLTATFSVIHKHTEMVHYVTVDIKDPVIKLKREVAKLFNLDARQFEFSASQNSKTFIEPHFDWAYVWELILEVDPRPDSEAYVNIVLDPYIDDDFRGRSITYSIAEETEYVENLCSYLKEADKATALETISVIARLPVIPTKIAELKKYIETHKIKKYEHWYTVLEVKFDQPEELFMKMKLLENLLDAHSEYSVREQFINNKGIAFLIDIIVQSCTILINDAKVEKFPL